MEEELKVQRAMEEAGANEAPWAGAKEG